MCPSLLYTELVEFSSTNVPIADFKINIDAWVSTRSIIVLPFTFLASGVGPLYIVNFIVVMIRFTNT